MINTTAWIVLAEHATWPDVARWGIFTALFAFIVGVGAWVFVRILDAEEKKPNGGTEDER